TLRFPDWERSWDRLLNIQNLLDAFSAWRLSFKPRYDLLSAGSETRVELSFKRPGFLGDERFDYTKQRLRAPMKISFKCCSCYVKMICASMVRLRRGRCGKPPSFRSMWLITCA